MTNPPPAASPDPPGEAGSHAVGRPRWSPSRSFSALVAVTVVLAAGGLLLARVDIALLSLPFLIAAAWSWDKRASRDEDSALALRVHSGEARDLVYRAQLKTPRGTDAVAVRLSALGGPQTELITTPESASDLTGHVSILHSGPQEIARAEYRLLGADSLFASDPQGPVVAHRVLPPTYSPISDLPLPRRLFGLTGTHESTRPGDGGEFRDIHPYSAGDRLRRIDWKTTARRGRYAGDLYVRRTAATADATVFLIVDSRDDVGELITEWSKNTATDKGVGSLDLAREAASAIASGYIRAGDRVGFQDLASTKRMIDGGSGRRHLERLLRAIELSQPAGTPPTRLRPPLVPAGAVLYVISTFLDGESARMASAWRGGGHRVLAIDVLPAPSFLGATRAQRLAHRIVMMEREDRIRALQAQGVDVVRWQEVDPTDSRASRFRSLSRKTGGPR